MSTHGDTRRVSMAAREVLMQSDQNSHSVHRSRSVKSSTMSASSGHATDAQPSDGKTEHISRSSSTRHRSPLRVMSERPQSSDTQRMIAWNPEVRLLESAMSTLSTRVSAPPASYTLNPKRPMPLDRMSVELQHAVIMDDLLQVLMGTEGQYIRFNERYNPTVEADRLAGPEFRLGKGLDPSLRDLTKLLLRIATNHCSIEAFIESQSRMEYGVVNHALCAAMRTIMTEYLQIMAQMEYNMLTDPSFSLHIFHMETIHIARKLVELNALVQKITRKEEPEDDANDPTADFDKILETLKANDGNLNALNIGVSSTISSVTKGGDILRLLTERLYATSGDPPIRELLSFLLKEASRPYMRMLNKWLHKGLIADPYNEFLIREQRSIRRENLDVDYTDEYWDKRYTLRKEEIPPQFADERTCEKILLAGKFLNVVRECGGMDVSSEIADAPETIDDASVLSNINSAYAHANSYLLSLLVSTHKLPERLTSLRHYFFLDQADFFTNFLDVAAHELRKPAKAVSVSKLQSLLDLTLRQPGSITVADPYKDDISVQLNEVGLTEWLMRIVSVSGLDPTDTAALSRSTPVADTKDSDKKIIGIQALQLDFKIPFPLSLVISRKTILRYQLLFRHLVALKHIEQLLGAAWLEQAKTRAWAVTSGTTPRLWKWKARAFNLRTKMLVFIQQVLYYSTTEVMEPNWNALMAGIDKINTVDALMQTHVDFLDTCLKECMLTNAKLLRVMAKLMAACKLFATYIVQLSRSLPPLEAADADAAARDEKISKLEHILSQYEQNFDHHLKILMDALNYYAATETVVLLSLCARLEVCIPI
ncbi:Spc98 family-domain-containing protein [Limtongia smithiae]|uniref:Spc98 family-domain-containing protein n=1 Tax=Limtongia smithiae TaxID=1125753 RepID=UPI0034CD7A28